MSSNDDPDLEDGEIASDEEGEKPQVQAPPKRQQPPAQPPQHSQRDRKNSDGRRRRDSREDRNSRRPQHSEPEKKRRREEDKEEGAKAAEKDGETLEQEDELLGLCVRGASPEVDMTTPIWSRPKDLSDLSWQETEDGEEDDDRKRRRSPPAGSKRGGFRRNREDIEMRNRIQAKRKMKKKTLEKDICINFMKGSCNKGADCAYSHTAEPPRKMELCKFYLKDRCMKRDMCLYLHEEFPCKFFHTGLKCYSGKKCKFSHEPLNTMTKEILLKHMETAPKELLGDFPRLSRENAEAAVGRGDDEESPGGVKKEEGSDGSGKFRGQRDDSDGGGRFRGQREDSDGSGRFRGQKQDRRSDDEGGPRQRRRSPERGGRGNRRRGNDFRRGRGSRHFGNDGPRDHQDFGPDFGGDGPDDRRHGPRDEPFGPDGPEDRRFGPNSDQRQRPDFGPIESSERNFANDGDRRFGPRGQNFGMNGPNDGNFGGFDGPNDRRRGNEQGFINRFDGPNDRSPGMRGNMGSNDGDGGRFGQDGPDDRWGPSGPNFNNDGQGDRRFGPRGRNFDNKRRGRNFGPDDRFNDGPGSRNFQGGDGPGSNNRNGPDGRFFGRDGPGEPEDEGNFGPGPGNFGGSPANFTGPNNFPPFGTPPVDANDFSPGGGRFGGEGPDRGRNFDEEGSGKLRIPGGHDDRRSRNSESQERREVGDNSFQGRASDNQKSPKKGAKPPFFQPPEDAGSGTSSPFDFAKELAEYKNKKLELEKQQQQQSEKQDEGPAGRRRDERPSLQQQMAMLQEQMKMQMQGQQFVVQQGFQPYPLQQGHQQQEGERQNYQQHGRDDFHQQERKHYHQQQEEQGRHSDHQQEQGRQSDHQQEHGRHSDHQQEQGRHSDHQQEQGRQRHHRHHRGEQQKEDREQRHETDPNDVFPPPFTQVYPPFPSEEEKSKSKQKSSEGGKKHKKKSKRRLEIVEEEEEQHRRPKKEKRHKEKRQPVIVSEDGSFGGIKFKIKLNRDKAPEVQPVQLPAEFLSSDDERPLSKLVKTNKKGDEKDKDSEETDTESRLVIETHEEPEERSSQVVEEPRIPAHLPKRQQELFLRIQSHVTRSPPVEERSRRSGSPGDRTRTPTPEPLEENWYSSDDEPLEQKPALEEPLMQPPTHSIPMPTTSPKHGSVAEEPPVRSTTPPGPPPQLQPPKFELAALKDLSKINITELLSSIRQVTGNRPTVGGSQPMPTSEAKDSKDPRMRGLDPRASPAQSVPEPSKHRRPSEENKPSYAKSIYDMPAAGTLPPKKDSDLRFSEDLDERGKDPFGDVDLRKLTDPLGLPPLSLGLPFKPAPIHTAATEIEAGLGSHPPIDYKVAPIYVPPVDFTSIKIPPTDPQVKKDPRLRRLYRLSSVEEPKAEETKKPSDPRRKGQAQEAAKSPQPDTPFSPPHEPPKLSRELLASLFQLGLSAAAGGADPRLRGLGPQEVEALRTAVASLRPEDMEALTAARDLTLPGSEPPRMPGQGLLPTPGMGLLPTPTNFMMNPMGLPMDPMMVGPMGNPMGPGMAGPLGPGPMNLGPFGFGGEGMMGDIDNRGFRGFKGDRRGNRGNWRGGRDRNWDNRRPRDKRDDRGPRHRDKDDRKMDRKRSPSPLE